LISAARAHRRKRLLNYLSGVCKLRVGSSVFPIVLRELGTRHDFPTLFHPVETWPEVYESKVFLEFTKNPRALFQEARQLVPRSSRIVHAGKRRSQPETLRFSHGQPASLLSGLKSTSYTNCFRKRFRIDAQRTASIHPLLKEGPCPYHTLKPVCKPRE